MRLAALALLATLPLRASDARFTDELWIGIESTYAKTLRHPFLSGLTDGSLPRAKFDFYLAQDALYLREFSAVLKLLAAKAPSEEWRAILNRHATEAIESESELHKTLLKGKTASSMAAENREYTSFLRRTVTDRPFGEGLAAVLPCYWIYWEVAKDLKKRGSKNADYQRWIDQYSDPGYQETLGQVLRMMNAQAGRMDALSRSRARELFKTAADFEYRFWDMGWKAKGDIK